MEAPTELGCWVDELIIYPLIIYGNNGGIRSFHHTLSKTNGWNPPKNGASPVSSSFSTINTTNHHMFFPMLSPLFTPQKTNVEAKQGRFGSDDFPFHFRAMFRFHPFHFRM